jgi:3-hydroxyacyl-CoA dehydrogenase
VEVERATVIGAGVMGGGIYEYDEDGAFVR